jgi:hypothetical protein
MVARFKPEDRRNWIDFTHFHGFFTIGAIPVVPPVAVKHAQLLVMPQSTGADRGSGCKFSNEHVLSVLDIDTRVKAYPFSRRLI